MLAGSGQRKGTFGGKVVRDEAESSAREGSVALTFQGRLIVGDTCSASGEKSESEKQAMILNDESVTPSVGERRSTEMSLSGRCRLQASAVASIARNAG